MMEQQGQGIQLRASPPVEKKQTKDRVSTHSQRWEYLHKIPPELFPLFAQNQGDCRDVYKFTMIHEDHSMARQDSQMSFTYSTQQSTAYQEEECVGTLAEDDREQYFREKTEQREILPEIRLTVGEKSQPLIGEGTFGAVYKAMKILPTSETPICIKQAKDHRDKFGIESLEMEYKILNRCKHDKIVHCFGLFKSDHYFFLCLEYFPGTPVSKLISLTREDQNGTGPINRTTIINILINLLKALLYLHIQKGIIHYDVKPENILYIKSKQSLKLIDFGLATDNHHPDRKIHVQRKGTFSYMAPEVMLSEGSGYKSDIYSAGATGYHMITLDRPFHFIMQPEDDKATKKNKICYQMKKEQTKPLQENLMSNQIPNMTDIKDVVGKMLAYDYNERPETDAIIQKLSQCAMIRHLRSRLESGQPSCGTEPATIPDTFSHTCSGAGESVTSHQSESSAAGVYSLHESQPKNKVPLNYLRLARFERPVSRPRVPEGFSSSNYHPEGGTSTLPPTDSKPASSIVTGGPMEAVDDGSVFEESLPAISKNQSSACNSPDTPAPKQIKTS